MQKRTFLRIMMDILFVNNPISRTVLSVVNFCKEYNDFRYKNLKFSKTLPLYMTEKDVKHKNIFIFDSSKAIGANSK